MENKLYNMIEKDSLGTTLVIENRKVTDKWDLEKAFMKGWHLQVLQVFNFVVSGKFWNNYKNKNMEEYII